MDSRISDTALATSFECDRIMKPLNLSKVGY